MHEMSNRRKFQFTDFLIYLAKYKAKNSRSKSVKICQLVCMLALLSGQCYCQQNFGIIGGGIRHFVDDSTDYNNQFSNDVLIANFKSGKTGNGEDVIDIVILHKMDEATSSFSRNTKELSDRFARYVDRQSIFRRFHKINVKIGRYALSAFAPEDAQRGVQTFVYDY